MSTRTIKMLGGEVSDKAKKAVTALIYALAAACTAFLCDYLYDEEFVRYIWYAVVLWVTASSIPRIAFGFIFKTNMQLILLPAVLVIITSVAYTNNGFHIAKLGFFLGIAFSVSIIFMRWLIGFKADRWYKKIKKNRK